MKLQELYEGISGSQDAEKYARQEEAIRSLLEGVSLDKYILFEGTEELDKEEVVEKAKGLQFRVYKKNNDYLLMSFKKGKFELIEFNDKATGKILKYSSMAEVQEVINEKESQGFQELTSEKNILEAIKIFFMRHRGFLKLIFSGQALAMGMVGLVVLLLGIMGGFIPAGMMGTVAAGAGINLTRGSIGLMFLPKG